MKDEDKMKPSTTCDMVESSSLCPPSVSGEKGAFFLGKRPSSTMRLTVFRGYRCSQCGDDTVSLGEGLLRQKSTTRVRVSQIASTASCPWPRRAFTLDIGCSLACSGTGYPPRSQDTIRMNVSVTVYQSRYLKEPDYVQNCVTNEQAHLFMGLMIMTM